MSEAAAPSEMFTINIKSTSGDKYEVSVDKSSNIGQVKVRPPAVARPTT